MTTPTLRSLIAEAEQLLEQQASQYTLAEWQREADALFAEVDGDHARAATAYKRFLDLQTPDPATVPPQPQGYRAQTAEEAYIEMICGYAAGMCEAVDREIEAFRADGALPESIAGLEALAKLLGVSP